MPKGAGCQPQLGRLSQPLPPLGYRFFNGTLEAIDTAAQRIDIAPLLDETGGEIIGRHSLRYDYLVLGIGWVTNDFGTPGVVENCVLLDGRAQADRFRERLLDHCLRVSRAMVVDGDADARVRIAIVGGGAHPAGAARKTGGGGA